MYREPGSGGREAQVPRGACEPEARVLTTSYHTHNRFCDGRGEIAEYAEAAIAAGLDALGISSHAPLTFPDSAAMPAADLPAYCAEVERLREAYRGRLRIHLSLEFDYIPEMAGELWAIAAPHRFDYLIGSVHFVGLDASGTPWPFDLTREGFERGLREQFGGDARRLVGAYYERVRGLAEWSASAGSSAWPDSGVRPGSSAGIDARATNRVAIVGHLDLIKIWNRDGAYFREDDQWYRREVEAALRACLEAGLIVEVNTCGWREGLDAPYPSPWIVRRCVELGIPLVVTSDAHQPGHVADFFPEAGALLRELGVRSLAVLGEGGWRMASSDLAV